MAGVARNLMSIAVGGGFVLLGWGLMKATVPNKETMLKRLPQESLDGLPEIEKKNADVLQALKESASSKDPIWKTRNVNTTNQPTNR